MAQDRLDEAEPLLEEGLRIRRQTFEPGHRELSDSLRRLGELRLLQGRLKEAETLLLDAYRALLESQGPESSRTRSTAGLLAELYERQGDEQRSQDYRHRAQGDEG